MLAPRDAPYIGEMRSIAAVVGGKLIQGCWRTRRTFSRVGQQLFSPKICKFFVGKEGLISVEAEASSW